MAPKSIALSKRLLGELLLVWLSYLWFRVLITKVDVSAIWPMDLVHQLLTKYATVMQTNLHFLYPEVGQVMVFSFVIVTTSAILGWLMVWTNQLLVGANQGTDSSDEPPNLTP